MTRRTSSPNCSPHTMKMEGKTTPNPRTSSPTSTLSSQTRDRAPTQSTVTQSTPVGSRNTTESGTLERRSLRSFHGASPTSLISTEPPPSLSTVTPPVSPATSQSTLTTLATRRRSTPSSCSTQESHPRSGWRRRSLIPSTSSSPSGSRSRTI